MNDRFGLPVLPAPVPLSPVALRLVSHGIAALWARILKEDPSADSQPLLLSYDVHPTPQGPVLIEVNTNAGGVLTAIQAAREVNECCADWEQGQLEARLLALFRRDLLGDDPQRAGVVAIVDDDLARQPLLAEMQALAALLRPFAGEVRVVDAAELAFSGGRLRHGGRSHSTKASGTCAQRGGIIDPAGGPGFSSPPVRRTRPQGQRSGSRPATRSGRCCG